MKFNKEDIKKYANNLLIDLSDEELDNLLNEFEEIDKNMDIINNIDNLENTEPMHMIPYLEEVILRKDEKEDSLTKEEILKNCECSYLDDVKVPKVVK